MRARAALFHHLQALFETQLRGVFRYDEALPRPAEEAEKPPGKHRALYGRYREVVSVDFGDFHLTLESPHEVPPLGRVELRLPNNGTVTGPLDPATFDRVAAAIKDHKQEQVL